MELPKYALIGSRAVKALPTEDGGVDVLVYEPETDAFVRDMYFLDKIYAPSISTEFVSEERFLELVEEQRTTLREGATEKRSCLSSGERVAADVTPPATLPAILEKVPGLGLSEAYVALRQPALLAGVTRPRSLPCKALDRAGFRHYVSVTGAGPPTEVEPLQTLASIIFREVTERPWKADGVEESALYSVVAAVTRALRRGEGVVVHSYCDKDCSGTIVACALRDLGFSAPETLEFMEQLNLQRGSYSCWRAWPESSWSKTLVERWTLPRQEELLSRGKRLLAKGPAHHSAALSAFRELVELAPGNTEGYLGLVQVLEQRGAHAEMYSLLAPVVAGLADVRLNHALGRARRALEARVDKGPFYYAVVGPIMHSPGVYSSPGASYGLNLASPALEGPSSEKGSLEAVISEREARVLQKRGFNIQIISGPHKSMQDAMDRLDDSWEFSHKMDGDE